MKQFLLKTRFFIIGHELRASLLAWWPFPFHMRARYVVDSAHVRRVRLPSIHQFGIIDKNKGKYYAKEEKQILL